MITTLTHIARIYDDVDAEAAALDDRIDADLNAGGVVLLCIGGWLGDAVMRRWAGAEGVHLMPVADRYSRPVNAMRALNAFVAEHGPAAAFVHSIGETPAAPAESTAPWAEWAWYEAAVNEVFSGQPLVASCLYDQSRLGPAELSDVLRSHDHVHVDGTERPSPAFEPTAVAPPVVGVPVRPADLVARVEGLVGPVRSALTAAGFAVDPDVLERSLLVASELTTNAIRHGGGIGKMEAWVEPDSVTVRVRDDGPGIADPFAPLRPPGVGEGGYGLWLVNHESDLFQATAMPGGGTEAVAKIARRPG